VVFFRRDLFDGRIVIDQAGALNAIYAVFNREKCYRLLRQLRGRFTQSLLHLLIWGGYEVDEQRLFLSMMVSCGICFVHREDNARDGVETEYIAPELLPEKREVEHELAEKWRDREPPKTSRSNIRCSIRG
jgi:internalin A